MKRYLYLILISSLLLSSCQQKTQSSDMLESSAMAEGVDLPPTTYTQDTEAVDPHESTIQLNHDTPVISDIYTGSEFTEEELSQLDTYINQEIDDGFPGAVLLILKNGEIVKNTAYGHALLYDGLEVIDTPQPMRTDTIFDLASITKVFATTFALMKLEDEGLISTSDYVYKYLEDFNSEGKSEITIDHLLTHTSGFNASYKFYDPDNYYGEDFYSLERNKTMSLLASLPLKYPTATESVYSDLGFITLAAIVENVTGMPLDTYVEKNIYQKLNLSHTLYTPLDKGFFPDNFAATERVGNTRDNHYEWPSIRNYTLQGEVHDELAYYAMNGVSGNAGLFSNAKDLAIISQMLLNGGSYGDVELFNKETVDKFISQSTLSPRYCLGFDHGAYTQNYRRYGLMASDTAYGKTGWTGTNVLIDPTHKLAIILLTNKRHTAYEEGSFLGSDFQTGQYAPIMTQIYEMLLDTKSYDYAYEKTSITGNRSLTDIVLGIDRINDYSDLFLDKNIGLITNNSGKNSKGQSSIDILYENTNLVALFSPEHGIDGLHDAGERYGSTIEASTDLPVYSLYGKTLKPSSQMLDGLDLLAFDIQDVGARFYTYIYTMTNAMEACAENDVPFLVFDRPNPLGGTMIEGNLLEDDFSSFVGMYPLPIRHGLTVGELAMYINDTYNIGCDLTIIPMENWQRSMYYDDTSLEFVAPSPNMPTALTTIVYPGSCLIEATNISEGRGTDYPFELIGAPFVNPYVLADELNSYTLKGVSFVPTSFMPDASKYANKLCYGVRIRIEDKSTFKAVDMGISLIYAFHHLYEDDFEMTEWLNYLAGTDLLGLMTVIEEEALTREDLIALFETPSDYIDRIKAYYIY